MCVLATEAAILAMFGLLFCLPACGSDSCICFASRFPQRLQLLWRAARYTHTQIHRHRWVQLILVAYRLEDRERENSLKLTLLSCPTASRAGIKQFYEPTTYANDNDNANFAPHNGLLWIVWCTIIHYLVHCTAEALALNRRKIIIIQLTEEWLQMPIADTI